MIAPRTNASRDQNHTTTLMGVSTADGVTPVPVEVDPLTGQVQFSGTAKSNTVTTATTTSVVGSATSVSLLALNTARTGAYIYNDSTSILYIIYGATASTSSYMYQLPPNGFWEMPTNPIYTGVISGIWTTATGNARITEL